MKKRDGEWMWMRSEKKRCANGREEKGVVKERKEGRK